MATADKSIEASLVSCDVCLKEVPLSEAIISEAADYFVHFCGLQCYERWKLQAEKPKQPVEKPAS